MNVIRRWWREQGEAWTVFLSAQRPWEDDGPLRWVRAGRSTWRLHGRHLP